MLILAAAAFFGALHPDSLSTTRIAVEGAQVHVTHRVQVASLVEVLELDADGDGEVTAVEVGRASHAIATYVAQEYVVKTGTERDYEGGVRLEAARTGVEFVLVDGPSRFRDWVDVSFDYTAPAPIEDLQVEVTLFWDTSPAHIDYTTIEWADGAAATFALDRRHPRGRFDPSGRGAFGVFFLAGWRHILAGWDHLAFLVALVLASSSLRSLALVITTFTVAHSLTLALASLEIVDVSRWSSVVEQAIALSIAYVATDTLLHPQDQRARWPETLLFGLLHGLGFAGFLAESLIMESTKGVALVAFNAGVEAGQLAIVLGIALLLRLVPNKSGSFLAPLTLRRVGSAVVALLGMYWFIERF